MATRPLELLDRPKSRALWAAVLVLLLALAAATVWLLGGYGEKAAPAAPAAGPAGVGDTVQFTTSDGTAGTVTLIAVRRTTDRAPDSLPARPENGSYLVADFGVKVTQGQILVSSGNFQIEMGGRVYEHNPQPTPTEISATARPGHSAQGPVGFDAPPGTMRIVFYDPTGPLATFTVDR